MRRLHHMHSRIASVNGSMDTGGGSEILVGQRTYYAWGYGGQFIFLIPNLDLVVVTTSSSEVSGERRTHLGTIFDLVENLIIQPIAAVADR